MFCSECGNKIEDNIKICPFCNTKIDYEIWDKDTSELKDKSVGLNKADNNTEDDSVNLMEYLDETEIEKNTTNESSANYVNSKTSNKNKKLTIIFVIIFVIVLAVIAYFGYQYFITNTGHTNYEKFSNEWIEMLLKPFHPIIITRS